MREYNWMTDGCGWMNLASILLGLAALALPVAGCLAKKLPQSLAAACSLAACALALLFQIQYTAHLVAVWDVSALLDTQSAVAFVSAALVAAVLADNLLCGAAARMRRS